MRNVAVIGAGMTRWGNREATWRDLVQEAGRAVFADVPALDRKDIDSLIVSAAQPERWAYQSHVAPLVAEYLGIEPYRVVARTELACASGQAAIRYAWLAVASGVSEVALVVGAEKMCFTNMEESQLSMIDVGDREFDGGVGFTAPPFFAMVAQRHMREYHTTREQLAMVSVKNHHYSTFNPYAQFQKPVTMEKVLTSRVISTPLTLFDCSGMTDGAAAVILASEERARAYTDSPMWIWGGAQANLAANSTSQFVMERWPAMGKAAEEAYRMAGIGPGDVDLAEVHDCFTISEIIEYEELGLCRRGEGGRFIEEGRSKIGGQVAVNTSGGLLGCGHPLGATGIRQAWEIFNQFRGTVPEERRVPGAGIGLTHNLSGMAQMHSIMIYGKSPRRS